MGLRGQWAARYCLVKTSPAVWIREVRKYDGRLFETRGKAYNAGIDVKYPDMEAMLTVLTLST